MNIEKVKNDIEKVKKLKIQIGTEIEMLGKEKDKLKDKLKEYGLSDSKELLEKIKGYDNKKTELEDNIKSNLVLANELLGI